MRRTRLGALTLLLVSGTSCTLAVSLDGLQGPPLTTTEGGADEGGNDASSSNDGAADVVPIDAANAVKSCADLPAGSPDGFYVIDPDGTTGPLAPFQAYCDMTNDGGGWMLVTADMLGAETNVEATVTRTSDMNGGLIMTVYANSPGCGGSVPDTRHLVTIKDMPAWTRVRYHQAFYGFASCWHIFGDLDLGNTTPLDPNLVPFDIKADTIRDQLRMGGSNGDGFDGVTNKCSEDPTNFWAMKNGTAAHGATVVLRRRIFSSPAGFATRADCGDYGPGTTSAQYWEYRDVFVR